MKRGEVWTVASGGDYANKPRPAVILQDDRFSGTAAITICSFTTELTEASLIRIRIEPDLQNGLRAPSDIMVDKISTVPRAKIGRQIGRLSDGDMGRIAHAAMTFLGFATPAPR